MTGHDEDGRAIVASDEKVEPVTVALVPGIEFHDLWHTEGERRLPDAVGAPTVPSFFPGPAGSVLRVWTLPPGSEDMLEDVDFEAALAEAEAKLPGMIAHMEADDPGMHTTDSVDYDIVLSGEFVMELDDGIETVLRPGDVVVQNGTRHRWHNRGAEPAVMASVLLGAARDDRAGSSPA